MKIHIQLTTDDGKIYSGDLDLHARGAAKPKKIAVAASAPKSAPATGHKCPDVLVRLWHNGLFRQSVDFEAIVKAIEGEDYSFPTKTIYMAVTRARFLTKHGTRGDATWKQKYPAA